MREPLEMQWLVVSIVLSVALTVVVNIALHVFPDARQRAMDDLADITRPHVGDDTRRRSRVLVPWRAMLLGSLVLTIVINLALWFR